jgi:hypothetical protein
MRYIIDNLMNESLSFWTILTKVTFVTVSVASLILYSTCFVLVLPLGTFILSHVLVKCTLKPLLHCLEVLIFLSKPDYPGYQIGPSDFHILASMLLLLDSQLYCDLFLCKQSTFFDISLFIF